MPSKPSTPNARKEKKSKPSHRASAFPPAGSSRPYGWPLTFDPSNQRVGANIEVGPMTTIDKVMNAKQGDPPIPGERTMLYNPTIKELHQFCMKAMDEDKKEKEEDDNAKEKPFFGPEKPPHMRKGE